MPRRRPELDTELGEAAAVIASSDPTKRKSSKTERFLDKSGDIASGIASANSAVQNNAADIVNALKLEANDFIETSQVLISALDEVANLHPFISVAVLVFKTAVNLVIKRRENDGKVLALNVQMRDMMSTLLTLKGLTNPQSGDGHSKEMTIETRLADRMTAMVVSMKDCSKVCDSYNKTRVVLKILSSYKWEQKFATIATEFVTHSAKLQDDLSMYSSIGINAANKSLAALGDKMDKVMAMVFKTFQSAEERQIGAFVASKGGPGKVAGSNAALEQLLHKQKELEDGPRKKDHSGTMTVGELRKDMRKDVQTFLDENSRAFGQKFEIQQRQIAEEMKNAVFEARDDIIAVLAGPYERVEDKDMRAIWKDMGWRGSVKARHLVLAVHDYFTEQCHAKRSTNASLPEGADKVKINTSDEWALSYLDIIRVRTLIEAMDDDVSSFVTISEVNAFTRARPTGWSLPYWIAYNTIGIELSVNFYYHRLNSIQWDIYQASKHVLPENRNAVNDLLSSSYVSFFDEMLSGIEESVTEPSFDWNTNSLFLKFESYVLDEEERMRAVLESFFYRIDDELTLRLASNTGRPEKYVFAILCILYNLYLQVIKEASNRVLDEDVLLALDSSLDTIWNVMVNRAESLKAIFKLQNLNSSEQMEKYCFGMYRFVLEDTTYEGKYWQQAGDFASDAGVLLEADWDLSSDTDDQESEHSAAEEDGSSETDDQTPEDSTTEEDASSDTDERDAEDSSSIENEYAGISSLLDNVGATSDTDEQESEDSASIDNEYAGISSLLDSVGAARDGPSYESEPGSKTTPLMENTEPETVPRIVLDPFFRPKQDDFPVYQSSPSVDIPSDTSAPSVSSYSIIGTWSGRYMEDSVQGAAFTFTVQEEEPDGSFTGFGIDNIGNFLIKGSRDKKTIEFIMTHTAVVDSADSSDSADSFEGTFNGSFDRVDGQRESLDEGAEAFYLLKKPLIYVVCRPSDEEIEANRPRALWKFAIDAAVRVARRKVFTWNTVRERRDTRRRFLELQSRDDESGDLEPDESEELEHLNLVTDPEDLGYWLAVLRFIHLREILHNNIICVNCGADPIRTTKMTCLECSRGVAAEFCVNCFDKSVRVDTDDVKTHHASSHAVLQLRTIIPTRYMYSTLKKARSTLSEAQNRFWRLGRDGNKVSPERPKSAGLPVESKCISCSESVVSPFWCCLACEDLHEGVSVVVCMHCNSRVEKEEPWLFERVISPLDAHNWAHPLVLVHPPQDEVSEFSVETKLQRLEDTLQSLGNRIEGVESMITTRLQEIERLVLGLSNASGRGQTG